MLHMTLQIDTARTLLVATHRRTGRIAPLFEVTTQPNLVKPLVGCFRDYVVDSLGQINRLICLIYPMRCDIMAIESN
jgi:hypothetical protein